ncbi:MAG: hypothetical protein GX121_06855 [Ignavibacteria bacterium]|nr:hypothetical protein [Ignavibacteria bacterium]
MLGFSDSLIITEKNNWYIVYDEDFKKISEKSVSSIGAFRNVSGGSMNFVKNNWVVTYDRQFRKISERPNR